MYEEEDWRKKAAEKRIEKYIKIKREIYWWDVCAVDKEDKQAGKV